MPLFMVQLGPDGEPEPMFCSVCGNWQGVLVYFLSGNIEVSMCPDCIQAARKLAIEALERLTDSRA